MINMGVFISKSNTKLTRIEQLEALDKEIKELMEFQAKNQRLQRLWVGRLLMYSSVLYLLTSLLVYWVFLPEQWLHRLTMAMPFFAYPVLVCLIRKLFIFLFSKRTETNNDKLEELKTSKRKLLDEVMETETYKTAKEILERFDPEANKKHELESAPRPGQDIRQRSVGRRAMSIGPALATPSAAPGGSPGRYPVGLHPPGLPLARPILPRKRGAVDRVIEYLVGDGPQNRYALICKQCFSHNGMALKEEFQYVGFRCGYCYFMNPARRTRPQAPRLPEFSYERRLRAEASTPPTIPSSTGKEEKEPLPTDEEETVGETTGETAVCDRQEQPEADELDQLDSGEEKCPSSSAQSEALLD